MTFIAKPTFAIEGEGATVMQGQEAELTATIENQTDRSRTGATTVSFSLPEGVRLQGAVEAGMGGEAIQAKAIEGGFAVTVGELAPHVPIAVKYRVAVDEGARLGTNIVEMRVAPELGEEAVARAVLAVTGNGRLAIRAGGATLEPGRIERLTAHIANETIGSRTGKTTVSFALPEGVSLEGDVASAVRATYGGRALSPAAAQGGFSVAVSDFAYGEALDVSYMIRVADDAEPGIRAISILADPASSGLVSTSAEVPIEVVAAASGQPSAGEIAGPTTADDVSQDVEEATRGLVSVDAPTTEVSDDGREAQVALTVRIADEDAEDTAAPLEPEVVGEAVVASVFKSSEAAISRAETALAQSFDNPSVKLADLKRATEAQIADFARRCIAAILPPEGEAQTLAAGDGQGALEALRDRTMSILVVIDQGTRDEVDITYTFTFEARAAEPPDAGDAGETVVYRLYNPNDGQHLMTADPNEYESLPAYGWRKEGERYVLPSSSSVGIHRLYNASNGDHLYTTSDVEVEALEGAGWKDEGVKLYGAEGDDAVPIYRLWNRCMTAAGGRGSHLWTESPEEYDALPALDAKGWQQEGEVWRAIRLIG